jgi:hypothetical protein
VSDIESPEGFADWLNVQWMEGEYGERAEVLIAERDAAIRAPLEKRIAELEAALCESADRLRAAYSDLAGYEPVSEEECFG